MGHIQQHPGSQSGRHSSISLHGISSLQGLTFSLTTEMPNITWRFMHIEAKSYFQQCLCRADFWNQVVFVAFRDQRDKCPLSGSNCHLCCFQCWSSLCSGCCSPGAELCQSYKCTCSHCRDALLLFTWVPRWAHTQTLSKVPAVLLLGLHPHAPSHWKFCILLRGCGTSWYPVGNAQIFSL